MMVLRLVYFCFVFPPRFPCSLSHCNPTLLFPPVYLPLCLVASLCVCVCVSVCLSVCLVSVCLSCCRCVCVLLPLFSFFSVSVSPLLACPQTLTYGPQNPTQPTPPTQNDAPSTKRAAARRLLVTIKHMLAVDWSPSLLDIVPMLLIYMPESCVYGVVEEMWGVKPLFFPHNEGEFESWAATFNVS